MTYANILVSVDLGKAAAGRIRLAGSLAERFACTLTGAAARKVPTPLLVRDIYDAERLEAENERKIGKELERARSLFAEVVGPHARSDWRWALEDPLHHLVRQARAADLVVVGRLGPDDEGAGAFAVPPEPVVLEAARPVLVVPPGIEHLKGSRVVVAWKDGTPARRAIAAALPFIRNAEEVLVVTVGRDAQREKGDEVAAHLARHGAVATTHVVQGSGTQASEILCFARQQNADLVVMGAYGHSRLREYMFGGVTLDILLEASICCLMSS